MTREEHEQIISDIAKALPEDNDGSVAVLLARLQDDYSGFLNDHSAALEVTKDLTEKNEKLRDANMEMLLSRGATLSNPETAPTVESTAELPDLDIAKLAENY